MLKSELIIEFIPLTKLFLYKKKKKDFRCALANPMAYAHAVRKRLLAAVTATANREG